MEEVLKKMLLGVYLDKKQLLEVRDSQGEELVQKPYTPPAGTPIFERSVKMTGYTVTGSSGNRVTVIVNIDGQTYCIWVDLDTWEWGYC